MMTEPFVGVTIVVKFGREQTLHGYRVTVVGNDTDGYRCQVETKCGRVLDDTTKTMQGAVSCAFCEEAP